MRLQQVESTFSESFLEFAPSKTSLCLEQIVNESRRELFLNLIIDFIISWDILGDINFGLKLGTRAIVARFLISMPIVQAEHKFVRNLIQVGYIRSEFRVTCGKGIG